MKSEKIRSAILEKYKSIREFAKEVGVASSTIQSAIETDNFDKMAMSTVIKICEKLQLDVKTFDPVEKEYEETPGKTKGVRIPVLGRVQAGIPIEAIEEIIGYEEITQNQAETGEFFALMVQGDSMEPKFSAGDVVIVRKQCDIDSGQIGIVIVDGVDATIKRIVKHDEGGISLIALNPMYHPRYYTCNEIETLPITIIGKVVELRAKF